MTPAQALQSGKGPRDENFPVASLLLDARQRAPVLAFYRFARAADDVADHAGASPAEKLMLLERLRATLAGEADDEPVAIDLRRQLQARGLGGEHGFDLLTAFRRDVVQSRYASWDEVMDYCRYSASPVGRMVLDLHGESRIAWPASDALCVALQMINHLQDCGKDRRELDRVYLPLADLAAAGARVEDLDAPTASPALRRVIGVLAARVERLLETARPLAGQLVNRRLRLEVLFIQTIAEDLAARLGRADPLAERVHHRKTDLLALAVRTAARALHTPAERAGQRAEARP